MLTQKCGTWLRDCVWFADPHNDDNKLSNNNTIWIYSKKGGYNFNFIVNVRTEKCYTSLCVYAMSTYQADIRATWFAKSQNSYISNNFHSVIKVVFTVVNSSNPPPITILSLNPAIIRCFHEFYKTCIQAFIFCVSCFRYTVSHMRVTIEKHYFSKGFSRIVT